MSNRAFSSEAGHVGIGLATLLAAFGLIALTVGAAWSNATMAWIGGIGAALLLLVQFQLFHLEIQRLWARIEKLEKGPK